MLMFWILVAIGASLVLGFFLGFMFHEFAAREFAEEREAAKLEERIVSGQYAQIRAAWQEKKRLDGSEDEDQR